MVSTPSCAEHLDVLADRTGRFLCFPEEAILLLAAFSAVPEPLAMASGERTLDELRREIDRIDNAIHDLLMQRTAVVHQVSRAKSDGSSQGPRPQFFRPGREARVLRRLLERHSGAFPQASLVRIWREIMSGQLRVQTQVSVAVYAPEGRRALWDRVRDQYGAAARYRAFARPQHVVAAVRSGDASIGVLPLPEEDDGEEPWWPLLADDDPETPRILSRVPFVADPDADSSGPAGLAIASGEPDASDRDRGCVVTESTDGAAAITPALGAVGIKGRVIAAAGRLHLIETEGLVPENDPRLFAARERAGLLRAVPIGGYAAPLELGLSAKTEVA